MQLAEHVEGESTSKNTSEKQKARGTKHPNAHKGTYFIISPFGGWNDRYYLDIYCPAVKAAGLHPTRADDLYRPNAIVHDIWQFVKSSKVMLADLTGKNPNVFYELGLAHALAKPVVLVTQSIEDVPFDLRALRVIEYDVEDPEWGAVLKAKIKQAMTEVLAAPQIAVLPSFLHAQARKRQTTVSPLEKKLLELQQQVKLLNEHTPGETRETIGPEEAGLLIKRYVSAGLPVHNIVRVLASKGVPENWTMDMVHNLVKRRTVKKHGTQRIRTSGKLGSARKR